MDWSDFVDSNEELLFNGNYLLSDEKIINVNLSVFHCNIFNANHSVLSIQSYDVDISSVPISSTIHFLQEQYNIFSCVDASYNNTVGSITFGGLYQNNGDDNVTNPSIHKFNVSNKLGIFNNVNSVIIDYNNNTRHMYFVGLKQDTSNQLIGNILCKLIK